MLTVRKVSAGYGGDATIRNISFELPSNRILAVVGPNGAGKTTLLKALNNAVALVDGEIEICGDNIKALSRVEIARRVAVVAQENETKFPMTVMEFVLAGRFAHGTAFGWETEADLGIANQCLNICGLEAYSDRLMNELSGGERQRVLLARAFATGSKLLLLDEPTNNLDLANQAKMLGLVRDRCTTCDSSAVVVTHDLNLATEFADEVMILSDGNCKGIGTPDEMFTEDSLKTVFGLKVAIDKNPHSGNVRVTPLF